MALLMLPSFPTTSPTLSPPGPAVVIPGASAPTAGNSSVPVGFALSTVGFELSQILWGTTVSPRAHLLPNEGLLVNATPTQLVVWPGGSAGDDYNPFTNQLFSIGPGAGPVNASTSAAEFVAWCRSISCTAIFQVPGETDNASFAAAIVQYTERTLGFRPAYWEIGSEPELWARWGVPWNEWGSAASNTSVTPVQYAWEVHNYSAAMRAVDPGIRMLGLPATGRDDGTYSLTAWVTNTTEINGPSLSGIALDNYAGRGTVNGLHPSLPDFYAALNGSASLPAHVSRVRAAIAAAAQNISCASCAKLPVFVTQVGSALSHFDYRGYSQGFPGALDLAAQAVQAMDLNLTSLDAFASVANTSNSWISFTGVARPEYTLYTDILSHLGSEAFPVTWEVSPQLDRTNTSLGANLYGIGTSDPAAGNRADLMVTNLNLTTAVEFSPSLPGVSGGTAAEIWQWNGQVANASRNPSNVTAATVAPVAQYFPSGLPAHWTLPPQSVAIFEAYPLAKIAVRSTGPGGSPTASSSITGVPVRFVESGLLTGTRWFVTVNGSVATSNGTSGITLFLKPGSYQVTSAPLPLPSGAEIASSTERLGAFGPPMIQVGTAPANFTVDYVPQWALNISADPISGGTVEPSPLWGNASAPLELAARPAPGFLFAHWIGFGPGSVNDSVVPQVTIWPNGSIREEALFVRGFSVTFSEDGLPVGTRWSATVRGVPFSSGTSTITFAEPNGSSGYSVGAVPGYRSQPTNSSFNVTGGPVAVHVTFIRRTPAPAVYLVTLIETGLPAHTNWSATVRNLTETSTSDRLQFDEANGSYGYHASTAMGFRALPGSGFIVNGTGVVVLVLFEPVVYAVIWKETGLDPNLTWSVNISGTPTPAHADWTTVMLANGSYSYAIPRIQDYVPHPRSGTVSLAGTGEILTITFLRETFSVNFSVHGVASSTLWGVRLSAVWVSERGQGQGFQEPNGTYSYDVTAPPGFYAEPSHGNVTVEGLPAVVPITFHANGPGPIPPIWTLAGPALSTAAAVGMSVLGTMAVIALWRRREVRRPPTTTPSGSPQRVAEATSRSGAEP